jgi:hypothetical protein
VPLRTKSERQIRALGSDAYSVKEEVTGVPANLYEIISQYTGLRARFGSTHRLVWVLVSKGFRDVGHFGMKVVRR